MQGYMFAWHQCSQHSLLRNNKAPENKASGGIQRPRVSQPIRSSRRSLRISGNAERNHYRYRSVLAAVHLVVRRDNVSQLQKKPKELAILDSHGSEFLLGMVDESGSSLSRSRSIDVDNLVECTHRRATNSTASLGADPEPSRDSERQATIAPFLCTEPPGKPTKEINELHKRRIAELSR